MIGKRNGAEVCVHLIYLEREQRSVQLPASGNKPVRRPLFKGFPIWGSRVVNGGEKRNSAVDKEGGRLEHICLYIGTKSFVTTRRHWLAAVVNRRHFFIRSVGATLNLETEIKTNSLKHYTDYIVAFFQNIEVFVMQFKAVRIYKTIILPVVLYGTWSLTLRN
jgi:hypothetical protein